MNDTTDTNSTEPVLDAPAAVGAVRFGKGVKWSTVIAAAQRHYEYITSPEQEKERLRKAGELMHQIRAGGAPEHRQPGDIHD